MVKLRQTNAPDKDDRTTTYVLMDASLISQMPTSIRDAGADLYDDWNKIYPVEGSICLANNSGDTEVYILYEEWELL